jgi:hypothetical protein
VLCIPGRPTTTWIIKANLAIALNPSNNSFIFKALKALQLSNLLFKYTTQIAILKKTYI